MSSRRRSPWSSPPISGNSLRQLFAPIWRLGRHAPIWPDRRRPRADPTARHDPQEIEDQRVQHLQRSMIVACIARVSPARPHPSAAGRQTPTVHIDERDAVTLARVGGQQDLRPLQHARAACLPPRSMPASLSRGPDDYPALPSRPGAAVVRCGRSKRPTPLPVG